MLPCTDKDGSVAGIARLIKGAFEIPGSMPMEQFFKMHDYKEVALSYLCCLKSKKLKIPKYINFEILKKAAQESVPTKIKQFVTTTTDKTSDQFGEYTAAEILTYYYGDKIHAGEKFWENRNFLWRLEHFKWKSYEQIMTVIDEYNR